MSGCCSHSLSASRLFSLFAGRYCRRFKKKGFEPSQKQLLAGLERAGYRRASLLEIGCGVGQLHLAMLEQGADHATGVDLSDEMIRLATAWAGERGLGERVHYLVGDFVELTGQITAADVTILDKVVCCYPDADALVHGSLQLTRRVYALTYPRNRWYIRAGARLGAALMWLLRSEFRGYVHDPVMIESWINEAGFDKQSETNSGIWLTQIYVHR